MLVRQLTIELLCTAVCAFAAQDCDLRFRLLVYAVAELIANFEKGEGVDEVRGCGGMVTCMYLKVCASHTHVPQELEGFGLGV